MSRPSVSSAFARSITSIARNGETPMALRENRIGKSSRVISYDYTWNGMGKTALPRESRDTVTVRPVHSPFSTGNVERLWNTLWGVFLAPVQLPRPPFSGPLSLPFSCAIERPFSPEEMVQLRDGKTRLAKPLTDRRHVDRGDADEGGEIPLVRRDEEAFHLQVHRPERFDHLLNRLRGLWEDHLDANPDLLDPEGVDEGGDDVRLCDKPHPPFPLPPRDGPDPP